MFKPGQSPLTPGRLQQVDRAYMCAETLRAAEAHLTEAQPHIPVAAAWGGGLIASTDGMRFVAPPQNLNARPGGARHRPVSR